MRFLYQPVQLQAWLFPSGIFGEKVVDVADKGVEILKMVLNDEIELFGFDLFVVMDHPVPVTGHVEHGIQEVRGKNPLFLKSFGDFLVFKFFKAVAF